MLAVAPNDKIHGHTPDEEMTMTGKQFSMSFSSDMDSDVGSILALMIANGEPKVWRANAVAHALDHFHQSIPLPRATLETLKEAYARDKFDVEPASRETRGVWLLNAAQTTIDEIGAYLEALNSPDLPEEDRLYIPKLRASKSGFNRALIIFFALRLLADEIRAGYPDLVPVSPEDHAPEPAAPGGRGKDDTAALLGKYPEVVKYLRQGMNPNDVAKVEGIGVSLNTIKKVKAILDEE